MSMSKYVEESYQDNPVDYPLDPTYCVMSDTDPISYLMQPREPVILPDYMIGSRQYDGLAVYQIYDAAPIQFLRLNQTQL